VRATPRAEQYDETLNPHNPPASTGDAPAIVVGLWYYLAPLTLLLLTLGFAMWYWGTPSTVQPDPIVLRDAHQTSPGGHDPVPTFRTTYEEVWFRGGDDLRPPPLPEPPNPQPSR
jgi:hypothetical protein